MMEHDDIDFKLNQHRKIFPLAVDVLRKICSLAIAPAESPATVFSVCEPEKIP